MAADHCHWNQKGVHDRARCTHTRVFSVQLSATGTLCSYRRGATFSLPSAGTQATHLPLLALTFYLYIAGSLGRRQRASALLRRGQPLDDRRPWRDARRDTILIIRSGGRRWRLGAVGTLPSSTSFTRLTEVATEGGR